jgi:tetratricopeptide (TPR) repeat protein
VTAGWEVPPGTLCVIWLDASSPIVGRALGRTLLLNSRGLDDLEIGIVLGKAYEAGPSVSWFYEAGSPTRVSSPIAYLKMRPMPRQRHADAALFSRLAMANAGTPGGKLLRGLALHTAAQRLSSPFESREEQREIDIEGLELLAEARETGVDVFQMQLWEGIAKALVDKRMPDKVLRLIEPLATEAGPWPVLERAVAVAYREFTMDEEAARWLRKAADSSPYDLDLQVGAAAWTGQIGDREGEVELLERALAIQPGRADLQRLIAIARYRGGDPEAVYTLREMLEASPEDEELAEILLAGPEAVQPAPGDDG